MMNNHSVKNCNWYLLELRKSLWSWSYSKTQAEKFVKVTGPKKSDVLLWTVVKKKILRWYWLIIWKRSLHGRPFSWSENKNLPFREGSTWNEMIYSFQIVWVIPPFLVTTRNRLLRNHPDVSETFLIAFFSNISCISWFTKCCLSCER